MDRPNHEEDKAALERALEKMDQQWHDHERQFLLAVRSDLSEPYADKDALELLKWFNQHAYHVDLVLLAFVHECLWRAEEHRREDHSEGWPAFWERRWRAMAERLFQLLTDMRTLGHVRKPSWSLRHPYLSTVAVPFLIGVVVGALVW